MKDDRKTKKQLIGELSELRTRVTEFEGSAASPGSKEFCATILDNVLDGVWVTDKDDVIHYANKRMGEIAGTGIDAFISARVLTDFPEETLRYLRPFYHKARDTMMPVEYSAVPVITPVGRNSFLSGWLIPMEAEGCFDGMICTVVDVTERKRSEETLQHTVAEREKLEAIINRSRAMVFLWRLQEGWPVEYVSDNVKDVLGYTAEDLLSGRISWPGITHPDDLLEIEAEVEKFLEEGVDEFTHEYRVTSKAGEIRWMRDRNQVLRDPDGTATHMQSILTDITKYKLAEKELRDMHGIVNRSSIVAYMCKADEDWTTEFISDNVHEVLGYSPEDFYSGRVRYSEIVHPDDFQRAKAEYEKLAQDNEPDEINIEYRLKTGSGEEIWIEDRSWAIRDANGKVAYVQGVDVDITERKQAEEEIESKSRTNQTILDAFPCVALLLRPQTREIVASNKMAVEVGAIPGKTCFETWFQRETPCPWCLAQKVWSDGKAQHCEPTSMGVTWDVYWIPVSDDIYMHFAFDITERKKAEEEFENIFNLSPDMVGVFTTDGELLKVNPSWEKVLGYTPEELLDMDWTSLVHPDDVERTKSEVERQFKGSTVVDFVNRYRSKDGSYKTLSWQATFAQEGIVHATARDITEHRKAEEALRASEEKHRSLVESVGIGITMISPQMEVLSINNQFKQWFPDVDISKRPLCYKVFKDPPRDEICSYCPTAKVLKDGQVHEAVTQTPAGDEIRKYRIISSPVRDADGRVVAVIEGVEDITDRVRLEDEMHKADKLESVGVLAGGIAHDFNNIMTAVFGNISLAKMEVEPDSEIEELLSEAEMAATRAKDLTHQLLTFSKGGSPVKETASIEEIIRDSSSFVLHGANVKCELSLDDDLRGVEVDVGQMSQVISNLVINADQAMPDGGVVAINAENVSVGRKDPIPLKSGKYIKITIEDQGIGINEEHLGKIFDPFFTTKQKGSGLGLATTYSIIKRHDGHIEVASEIGVGTVFRIYLPATKKKKTQTAKGIGDESLIGTGRILIMDDEELVRKTAGMTLKRLGYEVDFASDGAEALVKYHQAMKTDQPFDAVILDLTVPGGMGGQECIKRLKALDPAVKAVVSSGYSNDLVVSNFSEYGFCGTANKPYKAKELGRAMQEMLTAE